MKPHKYYNMISRLYDPFSKAPYEQARREAIQELRLPRAAAVLDIACGTGLNFPLLVEGVGPEGQIIGLDYSQGMLRRAAAKVEANGWDNVTLVHQDARDISADLLRQHLGDRPLDAVVCTLGFSVVPDWQVVFDKSFGLLRHGGRYVIMDGRTLEGIKRPLNPIVVPLTRLFASADIRRELWKPLENRVSDFRMTHFLIGYVFVASGTKPP